MVDEENTSNRAEQSAERPNDTNNSYPSGEPVALEPKKQHSLTWIGYAILVFVVALAGGSWFFLQHLRSEQQEGTNGTEQQLLQISQQLTSMQGEIASLHQQVATIQSQEATDEAKSERLLSEQTAQWDARLNALHTEVGGAVQRIQRQLNKTHGDLLVADAEYLLSIANQKLHLVGDIKAVLAAMEAADQRLRDSGDPAVFKVREALAAEIGSLRKLDSPDVVGISAELLVLEEKVKVLPLFLPHAGTLKEHADKSVSHKVSTDKEKTGDILDTTIEDLKSLVTVRRTEIPIDAVLTPEEVEIFRQVLLLKLETTRAALLRGDEALYQTSLESARNWLKQHFDTSAPQTRAFEETILLLLKRFAQVPFPDISHSLMLLRNIGTLRLEVEDAQTGASPPHSTSEPVTPTPEMLLESGDNKP